MARQASRILPTLLAIILSWSGGALARPTSDLFQLTGGAATEAFSSPAVIDAQRVEIRVGLLEAGAPMLDLQLLDGIRVRALRTGLERRGPGDLAWRGRLAGPRPGRLTLTLKNGFVLGLIFAPDAVYQLLTLPAGGQALARIDQGLFPECEGALAPPADGVAATAPPSPPVQPAGGTVLLDVMSLYSPQARDGAGGVAQIEAEIQAGVDETNTAFIDSDMLARLRLVHTALADHDDTGMIGNDLNWLHLDPGVAALRDAVYADMVSLIADSGGCGVAFTMRDPGPDFESFAFQVTERFCLTGNITFAHEHGHNMGFEHDPANGVPPGSASYPWSYGHFADGVFRTVMSYSNQCSSGCTRVPHFSNPDVSEQGFPTGIADQRDNHRTGNLTASIVRDFRINPTIFANGFESGDTSGWSGSAP